MFLYSFVGAASHYNTPPQFTLRIMLRNGNVCACAAGGYEERAQDFPCFQSRYVVYAYTFNLVQSGSKIKCI